MFDAQALSTHSLHPKPARGPAPPRAAARPPHRAACRRRGASEHFVPLQGDVQLAPEF